MSNSKASSVSSNLLLAGTGFLSAINFTGCRAFRKLPVTCLRFRYKPGVYAPSSNSASAHLLTTAASEHLTFLLLWQRQCLPELALSIPMFIFSA